MKRILGVLAVVFMLAFGVSCSSDDNAVARQDSNLLVLSANPETEVDVDETVVFTVLLDGGDVTSSVKIYVDGQELLGNAFSRDASGSFSVVAKGDDGKDSETILDVAKVKSTSETKRYLHKTSSKFRI